MTRAEKPNPQKKKMRPEGKETKTMKAIYFPQTVIPETLLGDLEACFSSVEMIQPCWLEIPEPMSRSVVDGFLTVRAGMEEHGARIKVAVEGFQAFARMHGSKGDLRTRYFSFLKGSGTDEDERVASQIVSVLKKGQTESAKPKPEDPAFRAALFLYLAQQFDIQNFGVEKDLRSLVSSEAILAQSLLGKEPSRLKTASVEPETPGDHMASERLAAWTRLFFSAFKEGFADKEAVWVTHSRLAVEQLAENTSTLTRTARLKAISSRKESIEMIPSWKDAFQEGLARAKAETGFRIPDPLAEASAPFRGPRNLSVAVYAFQEAPETVFRHAAGLPGKAGIQETASRATLVIHLAP